MKRMRIGKTDIEVSAVSLGTLSIGGDSIWGPSDEAESIRTIHRARELGINFFDTAAFYGFGRSETILGKAVGNRRDQYIISTKCGLEWDTGQGAYFFERDGHIVTRNLSSKAVRKGFEDSLRRLGMDYVDILFTHWQAVEPYFTPIEETMGTLCELKKEGKIRAIGASNVSLEQIKEYMKYGQLDIVQNRFSMLEQDSFREVNRFCLDNGITFHAYSVFERGLLTGAIDMHTIVKPGDARNDWSEWYRLNRRRAVLDVLAGWTALCGKYDCTLAGLVVAWTLQQAPNVNVVAGSRRVKVIEENARGGEIVIEAADLEAMNTAINNLINSYGNQ